MLQHAVVSDACQGSIEVEQSLFGLVWFGQTPLWHAALCGRLRLPPRKGLGDNVLLRAVRCDCLRLPPVVIELRLIVVRGRAIIVRSNGILECLSDVAVG